MSIYTAVLTCTDEGYDVEFPDVPGAITYGETIEEAIRSAKDALGGCLCVYQDENEPLPEPRTPDQIPVQSGQFPVAIDFDLAEYRRQTDSRAVRKNVSIPAWMAYQAEQRGINCSQLLQEALRKALA